MYTYRITYLNQNNELTQVTSKDSNLIAAIATCGIDPTYITGVQNIDITPQQLAEQNQ